MESLPLALMLLCLVNACMPSQHHLNVLNTDLEVCSLDPLTGYSRSGKCEKISGDQGTHLVCARVNDDFLQYTKEQGNDLSTPRSYFPGLKDGDQWCLCVYRWFQAKRDGHAPEVYLKGTNAAVVEHLKNLNMDIKDFI